MRWQPPLVNAQWSTTRFSVIAFDIQHRHIDTQTRSHAAMQSYRFTETQTHSHTGTPTHRHKKTQIPEYISAQTHTHTHASVRKHMHAINRCFECRHIDSDITAPGLASVSSGNGVIMMPPVSVCHLRMVRDGFTECQLTNSRRSPSCVVPTLKWWVISRWIIKQTIGVHYSTFSSQQYADEICCKGNSTMRLNNKVSLLAKSSATLSDSAE